MEIFENLLHGFQVVLSVENAIYCFIGCVVGTLVGVLPGVGPLAALSMLLPVTYQIPSVSSIIMLTGIFYGAMYGGSTTSILVNIPGEAASVVTCMDGHQMAKQGRAGPALGIAAIGSFVAGTVSTVALTVSSPLLCDIALKFGPPEYFSVMTLGFVMTMFMVSGSVLKAFVMISLGLFVAAVGMDTVDGTYRFTFGSYALMSGFDLVPVVMGLFGLSELLVNIEQGVGREVFSGAIKNLLPTLKDWVASALPIIRGSVFGFGFGILPGGGPVLASFLSYAIEKKLSSHPERFGKGTIEGVAGPEAANNSAVAASMVPLLSLGIPSNAVVALLMGALIIHGVQPGPMMMSEHPDIFWGVIASMYVGNVMLLILNLPLLGVWVRLLKIPYPLLFPMILLFCFAGTYSTNSNLFDLWVMIGFGVIGFLLRKLEYELAPFVLALVLCPLFEQSLRQSLIISNGSPMIFLNRPISLSFLMLSFLSVVAFIVGVWRQRRKA